MAKVVVGLYNDMDVAQAALRDLVDAGFRRDDISLLTRGAREEEGREGAVRREEDDRAGEGAGMGAGAGAVVGGLGGLLVGLGTLLLPGLGLVIAAGPIVATIIGAGIGAGVGALVGALIGMGIPEEEAQYYAEGVRRGGVLVSVEAAEEEVDRASGILARHNPVDVRERAAEWRSAGWAPAEHEVARPAERRLPMEHRPFVDLDADYRRHFESTYAATGVPYERYEPAYRYGYSLAYDSRYADMDWSAVESHARRGWDDTGYGAWEHYRDAVREGFERVRGGRTVARGGRP